MLIVLCENCFLPLAVANADRSQPQQRLCLFLTSLYASFRPFPHTPPSETEHSIPAIPFLTY